MLRVGLCPRKDRLNKTAEFLRLCYGRSEALVEDKGRCQVGKQSFPVAGGPAQVVYLVPVSHLLVFVQFVLGKVHSEGQVLFSHELLEFGERLLTKVPELHHVRYFELHQVAKRFDVGCLEAVVCTNRKVEDVQRRLEQLAHVQHFFVHLFDFGVFAGFEFDRLVGEEAEVLDQNVCSAFECFLGMDGAVRFDIEQEFLIVRLLFHARIFNAELNVLDGREDRVDRNVPEDLFAGLVFLSGKVSASFVDGEFDFKVCRLIEVADHVIRVEDLECRRKPGDISSQELLLLLYRYRDLVVEAFGNLLEPNHLQVQDDFSDVFNDTFDRRKFMKNAGDFDTRNRIAFERREENPSQRAADRTPIALLQGLESEKARSEEHTPELQ